MSQAV
ncbi:hypothetical protein F383_04836 [Gossypium arboreum]